MAYNNADNYESTESQATTGTYEKELYTGLFLFKPCLVNPTNEELQDWIGYARTDDNSTLDTNSETGMVTVRLNLWGEFTSLDGKVTFKDKYRTFRVTSKDSVSDSKGSKQVMNAFGESKWLMINDISEFASANANSQYPMADIHSKIGKTGEMELVRFFVDVYGFNRTMSMTKEAYPAAVLNGDTYFSTEAILAGDFSEVQNALKAMSAKFPNARVGALVGIKKSDQGKYYQTYFADGGLKKDYLITKKNKDGSYYYGNTKGEGGVLLNKSFDKIIETVNEKSGTEYSWKVMPLGFQMDLKTFKTSDLENPIEAPVVSDDPDPDSLPF